MAISVSIQFELVGEHPTLDVYSLISEAIIKSPTITGALPKDVFSSVMLHVSKQLTLFALSGNISRESLDPLIHDFGGEMLTDWRENAANEDYYLECGIADSNGNVEWMGVIQIIANCDEDEQATAAAVTPEPNKVPSNLH